MSTNLREANSVVRVEGMLAEKNLEVETKNGVRIISGSVTIKISDTDSIQFRVRQAEKKSDGHGGYTNEDNKVFSGIETVLNDYHSIAEVGEENADRIRVLQGQIRPYYSTQSKRENVGYQSSFFNRVGEDKGENKAEFELELFIHSIVPEVYTSGDKQGEETGRAIIKGWMPTYNGIEPMELVAPKEDGIASAIMGGDYEPGQTATFYGDIINRRVVKTVTKPVQIGKPKTVTNTTYTNELIITGVTAPYDAEAGEQPFDKDAVAQAIAERESRIAEQAKNASKSSSTANKPKSSGRSLPW